MKFSAAAVLAAAAGAHAWSNVTYTTEVVTAVTTYCPGPTEISYGGTTYTVTEATTLTISDCPCTVTKPIITTSSVICHSCTGYVNSTVPAPTSAGSVGTGSAPAVVSPTVSPSEVPTAGAGKAAALSGAGLAGVLGLAAILL
ncbi:putative clock-controlled gene 6 protein [Pseudoneurospora amorphoporcata]|uniref:Clock-controlled gene 6 protein n=1 Tax=Pseudoneurospora amorphoporcata TaxID=241081 RepID=A0AAN6NVZ7_9PEZI|nr:putative clock-controlled gene 6 protein [Pseudoneurospora amorphoporcata]